jgi:hypothetical protein
VLVPARLPLALFWASLGPGTPVLLAAEHARPQPDCKNKLLRMLRKLEHVQKKKIMRN